MKLVKKKKIIIVFFIVVLVMSAAWAYDSYYERKMLSQILKLDALPASTKILDCKSPWFLVTDAVTTCVIEISGHEFPLLLNGFNFTESAISGTSHNHLLIPEKVGEEFPVSSEYIVKPPEYNGGHVLVIANSNKTRAIVDLYIE